MGRAERRRIDRQNRIENRKGKVLLSRKEIGEMKDKVSEYNVEALMTCFALAEHRLYGFGSKRVFRSLEYIDGLMELIITGEATIDNYKKELEEEVGVKIKC